MRLLMLPRYTRAGASSRVRMYDYLPALRAAGCEVEAVPLLDDTYVQALYAGRRAPLSVLRGYLRRLHAIARARRYDVVWLEKELLPWLPAWVERLPGRVPWVVDYDDAVFHRYDAHRSRLVRRLLGGRIDAVMRRADAVTAGNGYLAERARRAGCARVETVPTVVDLDRYAAAPVRSEAAVPVIGWIGSPATAQYLQRVAGVIERLRRRRAPAVAAVGARPDQVAGTPFEAVPWSARDEAAQVAAFDIGIMPLPDAPWERGKCGYKLIQYMACGLPVVASPVGVNRELVQPGTNGALAESEADWENALARLLDDPALRRRQGKAGRAQVAGWYSLQAQAPRIVGILQDVARRGRG